MGDPDDMVSNAEECTGHQCITHILKNGMPKCCVEGQQCRRMHGASIHYSHSKNQWFQMLWLVMQNNAKNITPLLTF